MGNSHMVLDEWLLFFCGSLMKDSLTIISGNSLITKESNMRSKKKDWFDEHVVVIGSDDKTNEIIKKKIKKGLEEDLKKKEKKWKNENAK